MRIVTFTGRRTVLVGSVLVLAAAGVVGTAAPAFATTPLTTNTVGGPSGGANTVTATVGSATFTIGDPTASYVQFQYRAGSNVACSATFLAAEAPSVTGSTQDHGVIDVPTASVTVPDAKTLVIVVPPELVLATGQTTALYNICVYDDNTVGGSTELADTDAGLGYTIGPNRTNLNTYQGPSAGTNTITATTLGGTFTASSGVEFQYAGAAYCTAKYATAAPADGTVGIIAAPITTLLNSTKMAITVPIGVALAGGQTTANYNVCIYAGSTAGTSLLVTATAYPYTIAAATTISTVSPSTGPAQGGTTLTVTGTNFPAASAMTATLAGQTLTSVASSGSSFTATVPAHAAGGPYNLVITTVAGTATKTAVYTYTYGITSTPATSPNTSLSRTYLDVKGVGFADLAFTGTTGTTSNNVAAHAYLVKGAYNPTPTTTGGSTKTNPQTLECVDVVPIDDTELICGLFLAGNQYSPTVTRTVTGCTTATGVLATLTAATSSTTCTFTSADIGQAVSGTNVAAGTTIIAVTGPTTATLSKNSTAPVTSSTTVTLTSTRSISDATISSGGTTLTSSAGAFSSAEVGHAITAPGVLPTGTVITAVNSSTNAATVSNPAAAAATGSGSNANMTIFTPSAVAVGTYTVTVVNNGAPNAQAGTSYTQSIISSGSTFTVADYFR